MTHENYKLLAQTVTNVLVISAVSAAWLMDKATSEAALIALLSVAGVQFAGARAKHPDSVPPAGPVGLALFMAVQSAQHLIG
jgi:hypothetical protein